MYSGNLKLFTCDLLYPPYHKNEILQTSVIQAVSRQCFKMYADKTPISSDLGKLEF